MGRTRASLNLHATKARPFLRWAGGKSKLVRMIAEHLPSDWDCGSYWEPFLGAGAMFFYLQPRHAVLSDLNAQLIGCYKALKKDAEDIGRRLQRHRRSHGIDHYYRVRERYNGDQVPARQAADFIYLNKACFNGIFRVNTQGRFNVPWGGKAKPALPSRDEFLAVSRAASCSYTESDCARVFHER